MARYRYLIDAQKLLPGNTSRIQKLKNNLISLLDTTFPGANRLFSSPPRTDGSEKWWTSQRHFGTVSAFAFYVKKHLFPNTKGGVRNIATTSAKIGHWIFMLLPVVTLMLCRKLILPDFWQNGLSLNSGRPVQHWRPCNCKTANAILGIFTPGISRGDEDIWCWSIARLTTYGGDWRCPPFPLQDGVGGFCRY